MEDKLIPRKVRKAIFIKKELKPTLNRDEGRELSEIIRFFTGYIKG